MKRRMLALLLAVLMLAMLTAAAFAEDTVLGVYNVTGPLTVLNGTKNGSFYADANEFELNCSGLTGEYSLVLLLEGDSPVDELEHPVHRPDEHRKRRSEIHTEA